MISTNNEGLLGIEKAWQTHEDSCFHLMIPKITVLSKRKGLAQVAHLIGTKLQIQVSGKYFRTVSVTSSLLWTLPDSAVGPDKMEKKSATGNSKQARSTSASCFCLGMRQKETAISAAIRSCAGSRCLLWLQWALVPWAVNFRVRACQREELAFPSGLQWISKFVGQRFTRLKQSCLWLSAAFSLSVLRGCPSPPCQAG